MNNSRPRVFVTRRIPEEGLRIVQQACDTQVSTYDGVLPRADLLKKVKDVDGILSLLTDTVDAEVMDAAGPRLRVISNYAVGFNNIDLEEATRRDIMVTNTPGVLTETTADLAWTLMMSIARRVVEADKFVRAGRFRGWEPLLFLGTDIHGATLGIIGLGRIGKAMARRARGFDMRALYYDLNRVDRQVERDMGVEYVQLDELLREADFITIHVPLAQETYHLIGERELRLMKKDACIINSSRGPIIDEKAMARALGERWIGGAALDVFEREPEVERALLALDNCVLVPHIGSASYATRAKMAVMAGENLVKALKGERPPHPVNPEVLGE